MEFSCYDLTFTSSFDSGNLARVERRITEEIFEDDFGNAISGINSDLYLATVKPDYDVNVWTKPDGAGTPYENGNNRGLMMRFRSWFHFGVRGGTPGKLLKITVMNMNKQGRLYGLGYTPVVKTVPSAKTKWDRLRDKVTYENLSDGNFAMTFQYRFTEGGLSTTYFAFAYPHSYTCCLQRMEELDKKYSYCKDPTVNRSDESIYFCRELVCRSLDGLRVDLITVTDFSGIGECEDQFDLNLFPDKHVPRCRSFTGKRVYFVSSRVHPGESQSSHVFNGFLNFILREDDPRAARLRRLYVFKLIPLLNPDGVMRGHYRTDSRGVNLNRIYLDPRFDLYPSIYAAKSLLVYYHIKYCTRSHPIKSHSWLHEIKTEAALDAERKVDNEFNDILMNTFPNLKRSSCFLSDGETSDWSDSMLPESEVNDKPKICTEEEAGNIDSILKSRLASVTGTGETSHEGDFRYHSASNNANGSHEIFDIFKEGDQVRGSHPRKADAGDDSDAENDRTPIMIEGLHTPHLSNVRLKKISSEESGIAFYIDLHGHASKRGCFVYGNHLETMDRQVENIMFARLAALNSPHFEFNSCNFTERNMYTYDKKSGSTKEGSGRVALYKALDITHCYTLECNYNTGKCLSVVPLASNDQGRATPPCTLNVPPKYTPAHFEEVGKAMAVAALDMTDSNPWSRLPASEFRTLMRLREYLKQFLMKCGAGGPPRTLRYSNTALFQPRVISSGVGKNVKSDAMSGSTRTSAPSVMYKRDQASGGSRLNSSITTKHGAVTDKTTSGFRHTSGSSLRSVIVHPLSKNGPISSQVSYSHNKPEISSVMILPRATPQLSSTPIALTAPNADHFNGKSRYRSLIEKSNSIRGSPLPLYRRSQSSLAPGYLSSSLHSINDKTLKSADTQRRSAQPRTLGFLSDLNKYSTNLYGEMESTRTHSVSDPELERLDAVSRRSNKNGNSVFNLDCLHSLDGNNEMAAVDLVSDNREIRSEDGNTCNGDVITGHLSDVRGRGGDAFTVEGCGIKVREGVPSAGDKAKAKTVSQNPFRKNFKIGGNDELGRTSIDRGWKDSRPKVTAIRKGSSSPSKATAQLASLSDGKITDKFKAKKNTSAVKTVNKNLNSVQSKNENNSVDLRNKQNSNNKQQKQQNTAARGNTNQASSSSSGVRDCIIKL